MVIYIFLDKKEPSILSNLSAIPSSCIIIPVSSAISEPFAVRIMTRTMRHAFSVYMLISASVLTPFLRLDANALGLKTLGCMHRDNPQQSLNGGNGHSLSMAALVGFFFSSR